MRVLVLSDSHGSTQGIIDILEKHGDIDHVFFLGDGAREMSRISTEYGTHLHMAAGNCDIYEVSRLYELERIADTTVLYTHGHQLGVKYGLERLLDAAKRTGAKLALFGHTHKPLVQYTDGIYLVNPGSVARPRDGSRKSYAIIDISTAGIMPNICEL